MTTRDQKMFNSRVIDRALDLEMRRPGVVKACRWEGARWSQPSGIKLTDQEVEDVQYLVGMRDLCRSAAEVIKTIDEVDRLQIELAMAKGRHANAVCRLNGDWKRQGRSPNMPDPPWSIDGTTLEFRSDPADEGMWRFVVVRPTAIDITAPHDIATEET